MGDSQPSATPILEDLTASFDDVTLSYAHTSTQTFIHTLLFKKNDGARIEFVGHNGASTILALGKVRGRRSSGWSTQGTWLWASLGMLKEEGEKEKEDGEERRMVGVLMCYNKMH